MTNPDTPPTGSGYRMRPLPEDDPARAGLYAPETPRDRTTPRGRKPGYFEALTDALTALRSAPRRRA